jgi:hypothetical protein
MMLKEAGFMEASMTLRAIDSASVLQHYIGIKMLSNIKQMDTANMAMMLTDFAEAQPINPNTPIPASLQVGQLLDISI